MNNAQLDALTLELDARGRGPKFAFTLFRDIELEPQKVWLVHDFLGAGELSCIFGPPGSGKSVLAGDLGAHIASERQWLGRRVGPGGVLYVAIERAALVKRRLAAFRNHHGVEEMPLAVMNGHVDLRTSRNGAESIIEHAHRLEEITEAKPCLILIDTVSRALAGGDENSPKDMGALVGKLAHIQERTGAHVTALHHIPADGTQRLRGHGALLGACDTTIKVENMGSFRQASVDKVNDGPEGERVTFELLSVNLHFHSETNTATDAPVVVPKEANLAVAAGPQLSANQGTVLNILDEAGQGGLTWEEWTTKARALGIGKTRHATLYDIRKALKDKRLVYEYGDRWFLSN